MRPPAYWSGHNIKVMKGVRLDKETSKRWYFVVKSDTGHEQFVSIDKETFVDNCCCEHGSQWRFQQGPEVKPTTCKHIFACLIWLCDERGVNNAMQVTR